MQTATENARHHPGCSTLVTGASGLLGYHLARLLDGETAPLMLIGRNSPVGATSVNAEHARLDLRDTSAVHDLLQRFRPRKLLHLAALADVDRCEREPGEAIATNVGTTANLVNWIMRHSPNTKLILISTDQVYDGVGPHRENTVTPRNVYALSKLGAEAVAMRCPRHLILRVNFVGHSPLRRGFADWLLGTIAIGGKPTLVSDVLFNPLHVEDLCAVILELAMGKAGGVVNVGAGGPGWSKAQFGLQLLASLGIAAERATIGSINGLRLTAPRPLDMRMDVSHAERLLGRRLPDLNQTVARLAQAYAGTPLLKEIRHA